MKKIKALTLLSSLALTMALASCGGPTTTSAGGSGDAASATSAKSESSAQEQIKLTAAGNKTTLTIGDTVEISSSVTGVTYASGDAKVATVDASTGLVTAVGAGTTSISATKDGYRKGSISITVNRTAPSGKVEFEDADHVSADGWYSTSFMGMEFGGGGATPVTTGDDGTAYIGNFGEGDKETLKFTSSKAGEAELVAYVGASSTVNVAEAMSAKFNNTAITFTGEITVDGYTTTWEEISLGKVNLIQGENTLELTMLAGGLSLDYLNVYGPAGTTITTVAAPAKETIVITNDAENLSIEVGDTFQIASATTGLTYTSSDETVATVSTTGLVTGVATGQVKITVKKDGMYGARITINVTPKKAAGEIQVEAETGVTEDGAIKATSPWSMGGGTPASGTTISTWPAGETLTVTFTATQAMTMKLYMTAKPKMDMSSFSYTEMDLGAAMTLTFNSANVSLTGKTLPVETPSGGWGADYVQVELGTVNVQQGTNTIAMTAVEDGPELDYFSLKPIA